MCQKTKSRGILPKQILTYRTHGMSTFENSPEWIDEYSLQPCKKRVVAKKTNGENGAIYTGI